MANRLKTIIGSDYIGISPGPRHFDQIVINHDPAARRLYFDLEAPLVQSRQVDYAAFIAGEPQ